MKKIFFTILLLAGITSSYAQPTIEGYEYWFNNDFANRTTVAVAPNRKVLINQNVPTTGLSKGMNVLNFRSYDNSGKYSSVLSNFFYKTSASENNSNPGIVAYEYWLDNDYNNAVVVNTPAQQQININELISMTSLNNGVHIFNIRFKDNTDLWSSVVSQFFYKTPQQTVIQNVITQYRFGFDNDFENAYYVSLTPDKQINLTDNLDLTKITKGKHAIHFQFKDTLGMWSVVIADSTFNTVNTSVTQNGVTLSANAAGAIYQWLDCNSGNSVLNGETNRTFTATQNGSYAVKVTQDGIIDTSSCFAVTNVGILENTFDNDIKVFPNPTKGLFIVNLGTTLAEFTVSITDMQGKRISESTYFNTDMFEMNLNVQPGIYLLTIYSGNKRATIRLIKN